MFLNIDFIFSLKDRTESLKGRITSLPLYFRIFCDRKLKPSLICVILDLSSESCNPLTLRKSFTKGMISVFINSSEEAVIMKSSAYRMKLTFCPFHLGNCFFSAVSIPSKTMFIIVGEIIPPCGVPLDVGNNRFFSIYPAFNHFRSMILFNGILSIIQSWLISSKHDLISASKTHWADVFRHNDKKH
ncbi:hypothetical protein ES708_33385 [subsurface metagenome]